MDTPTRKMQKRNDYNRNKLLRKIKRKRKAEAEQQSKLAEKELKKRLKITPPRYDDGKNAVIYPELIDSNYDQITAMQLGYNRTSNGHLPSRNYKTGDILKSPLHPTFIKALLEDGIINYYPTVDHKRGRSRTEYKINR